MKKTPTLILFLVLGLVSAFLVLRQSESLAAALEYPKARTTEAADTYHGVTVPDPYRWLEDLKSEETRTWVRAQDRLARSHLEDAAHRAAASRLERLMEVDSVGVPVLRGDHYFYTEGLAGRRQSRLLVQSAPAASPRLLLDAEAMGADAGAGGPRQLAGFSVDPRGLRVAYGTTRPGTRWARWRIRDVETGKDLRIDGAPEELGGFFGGWSSLAWAPDGKGFFYGGYEEPLEGAEQETVIGSQRLRFHRLGTPQSADRTVLEREGEGWTFLPRVSVDGRYLVASAGNGARTGNELLLWDLARAKSTGEPTSLTEGLDASFSWVGSPGAESAGQVWLWTDHGAPRGRLVEVDPRRPAPEKWRELIAERQETLSSVTAVGGRFVALYIRDARPVVRIHSLDGRFEREATLPAIAWLQGVSGRLEDSEAFYRLSGLTDPGTVYRLDPTTGRSRIFRRGDLGFSPEDFVTRQVFFRSTDGTRVPMFVAHRKGLEPDSKTPTILYGYGAAAWSAVPWFQPEVLAWMEQGGLYALANVRGGGEYGEAWHAGGIRRNKQNAIDDFLAAAEWLVQNRYTSPERLVARGGSASGPLVGAAVTQRPELFGASLINIPALDMIRLERFTGGRQWVGEFGTVEDPEDFKALLAYSPYHNLETGTCYPATLISAGELDETTVPSHAYKFTAALQAAQGCARPVLLQVAWGGGHSFGATPEDSRGAMARQLVFLARALGLDAAADEAEKSEAR